MEYKGLKNSNPILITGCYRSGTEYITQLLNNHPKLSASMYTINFMRFCYDRYNPIEQRPKYLQLLNDAALRIKERWNRDLSVKEIIDFCDKTNKVSYALLYDIMMTDLFLNHSKIQWAEKTQLVWTKIPHFLKMFPKGRVIHVIRDPRSVLASFKKYTYAPPPAYLGAIFNCYGSMQDSIRYKEKYNDNQYKIIKYEDIITQPKKILVNIFNFLKLSSDHDLLNEQGWKDAKGNPWHHNSAFLNKNEQGTKFNKQASINRWKLLEDWEIALCEHINYKMMNAYNYIESNIEIKWQELLKHLLIDEKLTSYLKLWAIKSQGIEEFPTDPLNKENWAENKKK